MKKKFGLLSLSMGLVMSSLLVTSCKEEDRGEEDTPKIFERVEELLPQIETVTDVNTLKSKLATIKNENGNAWKLACDDYQLSLTRVKGKSSALAYDQHNSGYYKAMYILLYQLYDDVYSKMADAGVSELKSFFGEDGCKDLIDHARTEGKVR